RTGWSLRAPSLTSLLDAGLANKDRRQFRHLPARHHLAYAAFHLGVVGGRVAADLLRQPVGHRSPRPSELAVQARAGLALATAVCTELTEALLPVLLATDVSGERTGIGDTGTVPQLLLQLTKACARSKSRLRHLPSETLHVLAQQGDQRRIVQRRVGR